MTSHSLRVRKVPPDVPFNIIVLDTSKPLISADHREIHESLLQEQALRPPAKYIPIPKIQTAPTRYYPRKFTLPSHYIKYPGCSGAKLIQNAKDHYDLQQEDLNWLEHHLNPPCNYKPIQLTENDMSTIILHFEKEAFRKGGSKCDCVAHYNSHQANQDAKILFNIDEYASNLLYYYWRQKRLRLQKPLMRKFQSTPESGNEDPNVPFRARVPGPKKMTTRRGSRSARKHKDDNIKRLRVIQTGLKEGRDMLTTLYKREIVKTKILARKARLMKFSLLDSKWGKGIHKAAVANESYRNYSTQETKKIFETLVRQHKLQNFINIEEKKPEKPKKKYPKIPPKEELCKISWASLEIDSSEEFEDETQEEKEFYERLERESNLTRKDRVNEILYGPEEDQATMANSFNQKPTRLGRIAFDLSRVDNVLIPDVEEYPEIRPLGSLKQTDKQQNIFGFLSDICYKPEDVRMQVCENIRGFQKVIPQGSLGQHK